MRIIVDTNVLIVIIPSKSKYHIVYEKIKQGELALAISNDILLEYEEQLKIRYKVDAVEEILFNLLENKNIQQFAPDYKWQLIDADLDDNKFVDCAIAANVDFLITNDHHFDKLKEIPFPRVNVITLEELISLFSR